MKKTYEITLQDIYGGDGFTRIIEETAQVLDRSKKTKRTRSDLGIAIESDMAELKTQVMKKEVHTFRMEDGKPVMRLGGVHGKLWGALREARATLYVLGKPEYRSQKLMDTIQIEPIWISLETDGKEMTVEKLPQVLNTMGKSSMIVQYFDVIPQATIKVTISYPDGLDKIIDGLLEQVKHMGLFNKRRTTIRKIKELN